MDCICIVDVQLAYVNATGNVGGRGNWATGSITYVFSVNIYILRIGRLDN